MSPGLDTDSVPTSGPCSCRPNLGASKLRFTLFSLVCCCRHTTATSSGTQWVRLHYHLRCAAQSPTAQAPQWCKIQGQPQRGATNSMDSNSTTTSRQCTVRIVCVLRNPNCSIGCFEFYSCKIFATAPKRGENVNFAKGTQLKNDMFFAFFFCGKQHLVPGRNNLRN